MIERWLKPLLIKALGDIPAVALLGPRQCGKSTLARALATESGERAAYLDLESRGDLRRLGDPELYFRTHERDLIILDEIHRTPEIFQLLRGVIDDRRAKGIEGRQFLLLGSASMTLLHQSESLAGRINYMNLTPFLLREIGADNAGERLWVRGGFPRSYLANDDEASFAWRQSFIRTYLERDVPEFGPAIPAETLHRLCQMLANSQGQQLNASRLAAGLGVTGMTVGRWVDLLVDLLLVRRLQPWAANVGKRLVRSPKLYVRDSGLVHALLGITNREQLLGHPVVGASWEGYVIENILAALPWNVTPWFYRTADGAEIDLLLEFGVKKLWAIEVKRSRAPVIEKGFHIACDDLRVERRIVIYPGELRYPLDKKTEAIPFSESWKLFE
jgi:predicted AAA+ superfamily ATPase